MSVTKDQIIDTEATLIADNLLGLEALAEQKAPGTPISKLADGKVIKSLNSAFKEDIESILKQLDNAISLRMKASKAPAGKNIRIPNFQMDSEGQLATDAAGKYIIIDPPRDLSKADVRRLVVMVKDQIKNLSRVHAADLKTFRKKKTRVTTAQTGGRLRQANQNVIDFFKEAAGQLPSTGQATPGATKSGYIEALANQGWLNELFNQGVTSKDVLNNLITLYNGGQQLYRLAAYNRSKTSEDQMNKSWLGADALISKYFGPGIQASGAKIAQKFASAGVQENSLTAAGQAHIDNLNDKFTDPKASDKKKAKLAKSIQDAQNNLSNYHVVPTLDQFPLILLTSLVSNSTNGTKDAPVLPAVLPKDPRNAAKPSANYASALKVYESIVSAQKRQEKAAHKAAHDAAIAAYEANPVGERPKKSRLFYNVDFQSALAQASQQVDASGIPDAQAIKTALNERTLVDTNAQDIARYRIRDVGVASASSS
jgi:hypothetical protein